MNEAEAAETERWRQVTRQVLGLTSARQVRAQAIVDIAESAKQIAVRRGTDPLDALLELHARVDSPAAKQMVVDCLRYVRVEPGRAVSIRPRYRAPAGGTSAP